MTAYRLSPTAQADLILSMSAERWGPAGRRRYTALLAASMRRVAQDPEAPMTRTRAELLRGLRSYHIRYAQVAAGSNVKRPVHVLFYRAVRPGLIEIVRVLHERMDPSRHIDDAPKD